MELLLLLAIVIIVLGVAFVWLAALALGLYAVWKGPRVMKIIVSALLLFMLASAYVEYYMIMHPK